MIGFLNNYPRVMFLTFSDGTCTNFHIMKWLQGGGFYLIKVIEKKVGARLYMCGLHGIYRTLGLLSTKINKIVVLIASNTLTLSIRKLNEIVIIDIIFRPRLRDRK